MKPSTNPHVLVTGATGYIGGRLIPELLKNGYRVRVMARTPRHLADRDWAQDVEIVQGDAANIESLMQALKDIDVAYYLIHAMGAGDEFESLDRTNAQNFATASKNSGVKRIAYLGGLFPDSEKLSPHLQSRKEVGEILLASGVPTTVLRAAVILGSGSLSFEMLRYLTERLPVMITPRWIDTRIQPIAVRDVLRYLVECANMPSDVNRGFDIGGPDVLTYREMMSGYAKRAGLKPRRILSLPFMTPSLSSHWVGLVSPVPKNIVFPLLESLVNEVICKEHDIAQYIPDPPDGLISFDTAVQLALQRIRDHRVDTAWSSAVHAGAPSDPLPSDPDWAGGSLHTDERSKIVKASPEKLWFIIKGIGGEHGWYSWRLGWWTRGILDRFVGGPGLRRGRRDVQDIVIGDALDWWRVEEVEEGRLLRLRAEMRLPGLAWLELIVEKDEKGRTVFRQRALFHPRGLWGEVYWALIKPFHGIVFGGMERNIAKAAEQLNVID